ncbi:MAG: hypothetical protein KDA96_17380 [Planctomycetaceae bacterium]|nr:hypothetical protein [Planctomycetaceae bacterium]
MAPESNTQPTPQLVPEDSGVAEAKADSPAETPGETPASADASVGESAPDSIAVSEAVEPCGEPAPVRASRSRWRPTRRQLGGLVIGGMVAFVWFSESGDDPSGDTAASDAMLNEMQQLVEEFDAAPDQFESAVAGVREAPGDALLIPQDDANRYSRDQEFPGAAVGHAHYNTGALQSSANQSLLIPQATSGGAAAESGAPRGTRWQTADLSRVHDMTTPVTSDGQTKPRSTDATDVMQNKIRFTGGIRPIP